MAAGDEVADDALALSLTLTRTLHPTLALFSIILEGMTVIEMEQEGLLSELEGQLSTSKGASKTLLGLSVIVKLAN